MTPFPSIPNGPFDSDGPAVGGPLPRTGSGLRRGSLLAELSWLFDPLCVLAAAWLAWWAAGFDGRLGADATAAAWFAAVLSPFMLRDRGFAGRAARGEAGTLLQAHALRFAIFVALVLATGAAGGTLRRLPHGWLALWMLTSFVATLGPRGLISGALALWQRQGRLAQVVAVVGAGPVADRLVQELRRARPRTVDLLGVFDDRLERPGPTGSAGSVAQLVELGQTRHIDWIVITLPALAQQRLQGIVQQLKSLSAPIGLCPQNVGQERPLHTVDWIGERVAVVRLAERAPPRWDRALEAGTDLAPRWIVTAFDMLGRLPAALARLLPRAPAGAARRTYTFDDHDLDSMVRVATGFGQQRFGYVVTPNADHLIRLHDDPAFRTLYEAADFVLLDSRFVAHLLRGARRIRLPVCTGSDLAARLVGEVAGADDRLVLVGGSAQQASALAQRYGLRGLVHHEPPMGFIHDPAAVEACLQFIEAQSPFRFCLLAVGSPQQEMLAQALRQRGQARGLALCVGAAIDFLTGAERRAPRWMQRAGIEWLFRLGQQPRRMAGRYLVRGPRVFALLRHAEIVLRPAAR